MRPQLLETYHACWENATDLMREAELLLEHGCFARAYMLAFTAIEISKSQLAADLFTRYIEEEELQKNFRDHRRKIGRAEWATLYAHGDPSELPDDAVLPDASKRMAALYVDIRDDFSPVRPGSSVSEREARELVKAVEAGLNKIMLWSFMGEQIGTKGFMK